MRRTLLLIALTAAAAALAQQPVFRSVMPDGSIVYGDKPAPGAKEAKEVSLPPPNIAQPPPAQKSAPASASQPSPLDIADDAVRAAHRKLDAAKAALEPGTEPRPGERIGTLGGSLRLTEAYFERIKSLESAIAAAQKELDEALARRNSLK